MEYYSFIESTEPLPNHLGWVQELKAKADRFADVVRTFDPNRAARVEKCSNHMKIMRFQNGYQKALFTKYCRVRGCPICAIANANRSAAIISRGISGMDKKWVHVTLAIPSIDRIKHCRKALQKLIRRKQWKTSKWITVVSQDSGNYAFHLFCYGYPHGKNYLSSSKLAALWSDCMGEPCYALVRGVERKDVDRTTHLLIKRFLSAPTKDVNELMEWLKHVDKVKVFSLSNIDGTEREEKKLAPSQKARQQKITYSHFGWMPNPDDEEYKNDYLLMPCPLRELQPTFDILCQTTKS